MATITFGDQSGSRPYGVLTVDETGTNTDGNYSYMHVTLVLKRPSRISSSSTKYASCTVGGNTYYWEGSIGGSGDMTLIDEYPTIGHNDDGTKTISFSASIQLDISWSGSWIGTIDGSGSMTLTPIPRYVNFTSHYVSSTTLNTISVAWGVDGSVDYLKFSLNGGSWIDNGGDPYLINWLTPNTTYSIKTKVRRTGTDLWTESNTIYGTTKDIGKISSVSNFNHGDSTTLVTTNPSGSSLNLVMKIGDTQIFSRSVSTGSNTITFSQEELDAIYRLYGSGNSLTATFILTTAGTYTDTKTATITLTGNQKTAHVSQGRCKVYVGVNGEVKQAVIWVGNNGNRRCI